MKALKLLLLGSILFFAVNTKAQVSVNVNIGTPPVWAPVGYPDAYYYYLPDIRSYYDVRQEMFICHGRRGWYYTSVLPGIYADFDLYNGVKVVLDFRGDNPCHYYETHVVQYPIGYKHHHYHHDHHDHHQHYDNGYHYGGYKHGHSGYQKVIYANDRHEGRYGGHGRGGHDHGGHGHGRRG